MGRIQVWSIQPWAANRYGHNKNGRVAVVPPGRVAKGWLDRDEKHDPDETNQAEKNGKLKMTWDSERKRLTPVGDGDLVATTKERFPQLPWRSTTAADDSKSAPAKASDQELLARLRAEHRSQSQPLVTPADIAATRARNPWAKGTENLTLQMRIMRHDKTLAAQLQADAGVAA